MLIELAHATPTEVAPRWRDRLRTLEDPAQRSAMMTRMGTELRAYADAPTRTTPKETRILMEALEKGKDLPPWVKEAIPAGEEAQMADLLRQTVQTLQQSLNTPTGRGVSGLQAGMTQAQADYMTLRETAHTLGLAPSMIALADLHYHKIMEDAEHVAMLRSVTGPRTARLSDDRLAESYLVATHQLPTPSTRRGRLAGRFLRPVSRLLQGPAPRLAGWAAKTAAKWDPSATMQAASTMVPTHAQRSVPALPPLSANARQALRGEVERRVVTRAALGQTDLTLQTAAQQLVTSKAPLDAVATRLSEEEPHGRALWQRLERFSQHHHAGTLPEALALANASERAELWYGTLAFAGEPPASLLRQMSLDLRLDRPEYERLGGAILHYARHRAKGLASAGNAERTPTLLPLTTPSTLAAEVTHLERALPTAHRHAAGQPGPVAQQEAATAIQGYALELELEQLDACFGGNRPDGNLLPPRGFAWSDATVPIGHVTRDPLLMERAAGPLPFSAAEVWEHIDAVERPSAMPLPATSPGLAAGHTLTTTPAPSPTVPPARSAPWTAPVPSGPVSNAPVSPSTRSRSSGGVGAP